VVDDAGRDGDALVGELELGGLVGRLLPAADDTTLTLEGGAADETGGTEDPLTGELGATTELVGLRLAGLMADPLAGGAAEEAAVDEVFVTRQARD
jgi:hypothetical protein